jgi:hypothetical protein
MEAKWPRREAHHLTLSHGFSNCGTRTTTGTPKHRLLVSETNKKSKYKGTKALKNK